MKRLSVAMLLVLACTATLLLAQGPPGPPDPAARADHQVKRMTTLLSLNTEQQQQATTIFTNAAKSESAIHEQMRSAHDALQSAIKSNNAGGIDQAASTIGNLTAQAISIRAKADAAFYQVLSPDQQEKYKALRPEKGFHGHGGPGGPGPMPH